MSLGINSAGVFLNRFGRDDEKLGEERPRRSTTRRRTKNAGQRPEREVTWRDASGPREGVVYANVHERIHERRSIIIGGTDRA